MVTIRRTSARASITAAAFVLLATFGAMAADPAKVLVNDFVLTGASQVPASELMPLIEEGKGKELSIAELEGLAAKITTYLKKKGYILAKAYLPAQKVTEGKVEIAVVIGVYDEVNINKVAVNVSDATIRRELGAVKPGALVENKPLEKAVWLIGDLPGVQAKARLAAGKTYGTSSLTIDVAPEPKSLDISLSADNGGNESTGIVQYTGSLAAKNILGLGDLVSLRVLTSGQGLESHTFSAAVPMLWQGGKLGISSSRMHYDLGNDFATLDADGNSNISTITWDQTYARTENCSRKVQLGYENKAFTDRALGEVISDRVLGNAYLSFSSESNRENASSSYVLTYKAGSVDILDKASEAFDALTAKTAGDFQKVTLNTVNNYSLSDSFHLSVGILGQYALSNLDAAEKLSLGGSSGVRAYQQGESAIDTGAILKADAKFALRKTEKSVFELCIFADAASGTINVEPWYPASVSNTSVLLGCGAGLSYQRASGFSAQVEYAFKLPGNGELAKGEEPGLLLAKVSKTF